LKKRVGAGSKTPGVISQPIEEPPQDDPLYEEDVDTPSVEMDEVLSWLSEMPHRFDFGAWAKESAHEAFRNTVDRDAKTIEPDLVRFIKRCIEINALPEAVARQVLQRAEATWFKTDCGKRDAAIRRSSRN